jgi:hypothetical protein
MTLQCCCLHRLPHHHNRLSLSLILDLDLLLDLLFEYHLILLSAIRFVIGPFVLPGTPKVHCLTLHLLRHLFRLLQGHLALAQNLIRAVVDLS